LQAHPGYEVSLGAGSLYKPERLARGKERRKEKGRRDERRNKEGEKMFDENASSLNTVGCKNI
jgi:hypothetical protein